MNKIQSLLFSIAAMAIIAGFGIGLTTGFFMSNHNLHISMDDNTRMAIESLNESIGAIEYSEINTDLYVDLLEQEVLDLRDNYYRFEINDCMEVFDLSIKEQILVCTNEMAGSK